MHQTIPIFKTGVDGPWRSRGTSPLAIRDCLDKNTGSKGKINLPWSAKKSGSASVKPLKCFHLRLKGTGCVGSFDNISCTTRVCTFKVPSFLCSLKCFNYTCTDSCNTGALTPLKTPICLSLQWHGRCRRCAKCSVMNEAPEAESNKVFALEVEPSDRVTCAWHVMINSDG